MAVIGYDSVSMGFSPLRRALVATVIFAVGLPLADLAAQERSTTASIDALLQDTFDASYETMCAKPDAADGSTIRLRFEVYESDQPFEIREEVARIEPLEDARETRVAPSFVIAGVFTEPQMKLFRRAVDGKWDKAPDGEKVRQIPGGKRSAFFEGVKAPKGWENCYLRAKAGEDPDTIEVGFALKSKGAPKGVGLEIEIWSGQWIIITGPVTGDRYRAVFLRLE